MKQHLQKYLQDMEIRGFAPSTIKNYYASTNNFIKYHNKPPLNITIDEINEYQYYLKNKKKCSWSSFNINVCALRFFYSTTLKRKEIIEHIPFGKREKKLPVVLSQEEFLMTYKSIKLIKHQAIFLTLYSCGLRCSELTNLKMSDIDSKRMLILVRDSKGGKDRYVSLSPKLLTLLRRFYISEKKKPQTYLFAGARKDKPRSTHSIQDLIRKIGIDSGLKKKMTPHTLRHSYATHMLENGIDIRKIQMLLGHSSLRTTAGYLHVINNFYTEISSPIEGMDI